MKLSILSIPKVIRAYGESPISTNRDNKHGLFRFSDLDFFTLFGVFIVLILLNLYLQASFINSIPRT
jgi:hypothetical protein